jgi:hypothetical protein
MWTVAKMVYFRSALGIHVRWVALRLREITLHGRLHDHDSEPGSLCCLLMQ